MNKFACALLIAGEVCAQNSQPKFEVASVKVATDASGGGISGGPGSNDPTQFTAGRVSMGLLLRMAFAANTYRLSAPSGLPDGYFNIHAKLPPDTSKSQFEQMLQNLLIERFAMKLHHEMQERSGYELVVAKSGSRLKAAEPASESLAPYSIVKDRAGESQLEPGRNARVVFRLSDGRYRQSGRMQTVADIIAMCERELQQPVVDRSGLTGVYDFNIDYMRPPDEPGDARDDAETPFLNAFQSQLGLRLERKRVPVDIIVIDHIAKTPTEN
jgi:uncharacterized protein (TIGR03435 family)